jgi:hypothetical protein
VEQKLEGKWRRRLSRSGAEVRGKGEHKAARNGQLSNYYTPISKSFMPSFFRVSIFSLFIIVCNI